MNASASLRSASPHARFSGITLPPSVNALWKKTRNGMRCSDPYEDWKRTAGWELKLARQPKICGRYHLTIRVQRNATKMDLGNAEKACSDLLQAIGIIENDKFAERIVLEWSDNANLLEIEVRPA